MLTTKLLVVGLRRGASWARNIVSTTDLELAGLVDMDAEKLHRISAEVGVPPERRYVNLDEALRRTDADIIVMALPVPLHLKTTLAALETGRHVILEKPIAVDMAEARAIRDAAQKANGRLMIAEQYRFADGCENLRRAIATGMIGKVAYIQHDFYRAYQNLPPWELTPEGRKQAGPHAGLRGMGVHHYDMWWYIANSRPVEINVKALHPSWDESPRALIHSIQAILEDGTLIHYLYGRAALGRPQTTWYGNLAIVGEQGTLFWDGNGSAVTLSRVLPTHNPAEQHLATGAVSYVSRTTQRGDIIPVMVRAFLDAIREGKPHPCNLDDNMVSFTTALAALESAETGRPTKVVHD